MNCRRIRDQLPRFVGHDLSPMVAARVKQHLAQCPGCREELDRYEAARRSLFVLKRTGQGPTPDLWPSIRAQLVDPPRRARRHVRRIMVVAASLLVCAAGVRLLIPAEPADPTRPDAGSPAEVVAAGPQDPAPTYHLEQVTIEGDAAQYESAPALTTLDPERSEWDEF